MCPQCRTQQHPWQGRALIATALSLRNSLLWRGHNTAWPKALGLLPSLLHFLLFSVALLGLKPFSCFCSAGRCRDPPRLSAFQK